MIGVLFGAAAAAPQTHRHVHQFLNRVWNNAQVQQLVQTGMEEAAKKSFEVAHHVGQKALKRGLEVAVEIIVRR